MHQSQPNAHNNQSYRVVLAGNPNCGKTSVFNALTGSAYKVANYPGVTVERRDGELSLESSDDRIIVTDIPGTYSLQGESLDERIAQQELREHSDLIVIVVDSSNLQRNLYLASEIIDLGHPVILALNMIDLAQKQGVKILDARLEALLDVPVVPLVASQKRGVAELERTIRQMLHAPRISARRFAWAKDDEKLAALSSSKQSTVNAAQYAEVAAARYRWIDKLNSQVSVQEGSPSRWASRLDTLCTHRFSGLLVFAGIMALMFQSIYTWATIPMEWIDSAILGLSKFLASLLPSGQIRSLVIDGILAGVGSVLIFIPQIGLLFLFIGILEDSGYLARAAFVVDRIMRKFGLQGRSFIPLLSSFACAIPGIMATRSIPSLSDRMITIMVAPLMSCSARLPIYTLLIAAYIPPIFWGGFLSFQGLVMTSLYLLGIVGAALVAFLFRKTLFRAEPTIFLMEMPPFRLPSLKLIGRDVIDRLKIFIRNAGSTILACSIVLWFLASHPLNENREPPTVQQSYAGSLGRAIEPLIKPLGFNWQIGIGIISSFAAREVFVSSMATVHSLDSDQSNRDSLTNLLRAKKNVPGELSTAGALSLLVFYVFSCQCMSTLAVCRRETGSWRWPALMFVFMTVMAYGASWLTFSLSHFILG